MRYHKPNPATVAASSAEIALRPLQSLDIERVKEIEMAWPLLSHWDIEIYRRIATERENARGFVAVEKKSSGEEMLVGFLVYRTTFSETEILNIAIEPGWARRQIGTRMLRSLEQQLRSEGVKKLFLEVRPSNNPAREFYLKEGFIEVGRRQDYYNSPTEDAILMKLELDD